jgi:hypothetical protein
LQLYADFGHLTAQEALERIRSIKSQTSPRDT